MFHDFMPWDDDVDLRVSIHERSRLNSIIKEQYANVISIANISDQYGNYDHFYLSWAPRIADKFYSYPYVDIFYYDENQTHVWRPTNDKELIEICAIEKKFIYPTVRRPFGSIWLSVNHYDDYDNLSFYPCISSNFSSLGTERSAVDF